MDETIAAVATPPGEGGIGVIRISGEDAVSVLKKIFRPASSMPLKNRMLTYGFIQDPDTGEKLDEVMAVVMRAPHTYTGEDTAEIDCHGNAVALKRVLSLVFKTGARMAEPGEFTKRAFLNGRVDLSQAEAVMDVVRAKTDKNFDVAMDQLSGHFSSLIKDIRAILMNALVELTVNIDYPDEDIELLTLKKLGDMVEKAQKKASDLVKSSDTGKIIRDGLKVAIIGKPNVGKSSLMNAMLRESRAIVTDIPGTTRDTIEEEISIGGIPIRLVDTAGIRETEEPVEKVGVERSMQSFNKADLILFVLDGSRNIDQDDRKIGKHIDPEKTVILLNKSDLPCLITREEIESFFPECDIIETAVKNSSGIQELEKWIKKKVYRTSPNERRSTFVTNMRHRDLLLKTEQSLCDAMDLIKNQEPLEIIEIDVHSAYDFLGEIIGENVQGDVLDEVFSRFCLGK